MLGPDSVFTAVLGGGRGYAERVRLVPWGDEKPKDDALPWPGRLPAPAPATVLAEPAPIAVRTADGALLGVDTRLALTGPPATVHIGRTQTGIEGWAGPWPAAERRGHPGLDPQAAPVRGAGVHQAQVHCGLCRTALPLQLQLPGRRQPSGGAGPGGGSAGADRSGPD